MRKANFIGVQEAAQLIGLPEQAIRVGLQQKVFPWGYAIKRKNSYAYYINADKLIETEGLDKGENVEAAAASD